MLQNVVNTFFFCSSLTSFSLSLSSLSLVSSSILRHQPPHIARGQQRVRVDPGVRGVEQAGGVAAVGGGKHFCSSWVKRCITGHVIHPPPQHGPRVVGVGVGGDFGGGDGAWGWGWVWWCGERVRLLSCSCFACFHPHHTFHTHAWSQPLSASSRPGSSLFRGAPCRGGSAARWALRRAVGLGKARCQRVFCACVCAASTCSDVRAGGRRAVATTC